MKKFLKSPWTISIATAAFSFLLTVGYDLIKGKQIFATIVTVFQTIWRVLISVLNFQLRVWWVLLGFAVIFFAIYVAAKIYEIRNPEATMQAFMKYTSDVISGWHWSWVWEKQYDGKYAVERLHPRCPKCDTPLICSKDYLGEIACPRCNYKAGSKMPDMDMVKTIIYDNINKGLFPQEGNQHEA